MTIIPSPGPRPTVAPRTTPIKTDGAYTVNSGETVYATGLPYLFESESSFLSPLINHGTIWNSYNSSDATVVLIGRHNHLRAIENYGLIVVEAGPNVIARVLAFEEMGEVVNRGQVLVLSEATNGATAFSSSLGIRIDNYGTIGVRSVNGGAQGLSSYNGGVVTNRAGASILVEGQGAIAIYLGRSDPGSMTPPSVTNAGRIEAVSTLAGDPSIGLWLGNFGENVHNIVNTGVIKADIAIYSDPYSATVAQKGVENIFNDPGGLIQGLIWLDRGNDSLRNRGTIEGDVYLGEGNDSLDNQGGVILGYSDLGWGNDVFTGSSGTDYVGGNNGGDSIDGGAGEDVLLGGSNDDVIVGGAGNDGLFGEYGNDRLVTQGADFVLGGAGDDRIETGDYAFEVIDGETGFDTWVLPGGPHILDLAAALASQRVWGLEEIVLGASQGLVVRQADVARITDGASQLVVTGGAGSELSLIGGWTEGGGATFKGLSYRSFSNGGSTVLVQQGTLVQVGSTPPAGAAGLDSVAGGPLALVPDALTDTTTILSNYELTESVRVNAEETWLALDGDTVLSAWEPHVTLTNDGYIFSSNDIGNGARAVDGRNLEGLINNGSIIASARGPSPLGFPLEQVWAVIAPGISLSAENHGLIMATSVYSKATAAEIYNLVNTGSIVAKSDNSEAVGLVAEGPQIDNSGLIEVVGYDQLLFPFGPRIGATGVYMRNGGTLDNSGTIDASVTGTASVATAIRYAWTLTVNNSGVVRGGDYAILFNSFDQTNIPLTLVNTGQIHGDIKLSGSNDSITNRALIDGIVMLEGGNDLYDGSLGTQTAVYGGAGDDQLTGGTGADVLAGGAGSDSLQGGAGADRFLYQAATDSVDGARDRIRLFETGIDKIDLRQLNVTGVAFSQLTDPADNSPYTLITVTASTGTLTIRVDGQAVASDLMLAPPAIEGTEGPDLINGTSDPDEIIGKGGDDRLQGLGDNDKLSGGDGNDQLDGGAGSDAMTGGTGNDIYFVDNAGDTVTENYLGGIDEVRTTLTAYSIASLIEVEHLTGVGSGGQELTGNSGDNVIDGGPGADIMRGGSGNDLYLVDHASDQAIEGSGEGYDEVRTAAAIYSLGANIEVLTGTSSAGQILTGNAAYNIITGGAGNDVIDGGTGADSMSGGLGDDIYYVDDSSFYGDSVIESAGGGTDEVRSTSGDYVLGANLENLTGLFGGNQTLLGNGLANIIKGGAGNDVIDGAGGADAMEGGSGDDLYRVDNSGDTVMEMAGGGTDEVQTGLATFSISSFANVEKLTGTGYAQSLTGNGGANSIAGTGGDDVIDGGAGADLMIGGYGNDAYKVDDGGDQISDFGGTDLVLSAISYALADGLENLTLTGAGAIHGTGNGLANILIGNSAANLLDGGAGPDAMEGGFGDDIYIAGEGDQIVEAAGQGYDEVRTDWAAHALAANVEKLTGTSNGGQALTGNGEANAIFAGSGNDVLDGGLGADSLSGGLGDDLYLVDDLGDAVVEAADSGNDEVRTGLASYALAASVEKLTGTSGGGQSLAGNGSANVIAAGSGNDVLDGGLGADTLAGGLGDDVYFVDSALDALAELAGQGNDEVRSSAAAYVLGANVEKLTGLSNGGQVLTGNDLANVIMGNFGNDLIDGGLGADTMSGWVGDDVYYVDDAGDIVSEGDYFGVDEVRTNLVSFSIAGFAYVENLTGGSADQGLTGNGWNNVIDGGAGADAMAGGGGHDVYVVDNVGDTVVELDGQGTDEVRTSVGSKTAPDYALYVLPAFVENLTGTAAGDQGVSDNALDNVITMGGGHDLVVASAGGVDAIEGGGGNDFIYYGDTLTGADVTNGGGGVDTIGLIGNYASGIVFTAANLIGVERLALYTSLYLPGTGPNTYNITMSDANVAAGALFFVTAASLQSNESLIFNGSAETNGQFTIHGGAGNDTITGGSGSDFFLGNAGNDFLNGGGGSDFLYGGLGADQLTGGAGFDSFRYQSAAQSSAASMDHILDFTDLDRIDLSAIDADGNGGNGNQAFTFIGSGAFTNSAGQLRAYQSGADWFVEGDTNGDGIADLVIQVTITDPALLGLGASDFNL